MGLLICRRVTSYKMLVVRTALPPSTKHAPPFRSNGLNKIIYLFTTQVSCCLLRAAERQLHYRAWNGNGYESRCVCNSTCVLTYPSGFLATSIEQDTVFQQWQGLRKMTMWLRNVVTRTEEILLGFTKERDRFGDPHVTPRNKVLLEKLPQFLSVKINSPHIMEPEGHYYVNKNRDYFDMCRKRIGILYVPLLLLSSSSSSLITFIQGSCNDIPETSHVSKVVLYVIAATLWLQ